MQRSTKRPRLTSPVTLPGRVAQKECNPVEAELARHHQSTEVIRAKLKSRFEDIFEKYEKDFTGIGDEIDLATGEVVVDNGHLSHMRSEQDAEGDYVNNYNGFNDLSGSDDPTVYAREDDHEDLVGLLSPRRATIQSRPPLDPRWAAPEVPGLSREPLVERKLDTGWNELDSSLGQQSSPEMSSIWQEPRPKRTRKNWTDEEMDIFYQLKGMDRDWSISELQEFFPSRCFGSVYSKWQTLFNRHSPSSLLKPIKRTPSQPRSGPNRYQHHQKWHSPLVEAHKEHGNATKDSIELESDEDILSRPSPSVRSSTMPKLPAEQQAYATTSSSPSRPAVRITELQSHQLKKSPVYSPLALRREAHDSCPSKSQEQNLCSNDRPLYFPDTRESPLSDLKGQFRGPVASSPDSLNGCEEPSRSAASVPVPQAGNASLTHVKKSSHKTNAKVISQFEELASRQSSMSQAGKSPADAKNLDQVKLSGSQSPQPRNSEGAMRTQNKPEVDASTSDVRSSPSSYNVQTKGKLFRQAATIQLRPGKPRASGLLQSATDNSILLSDSSEDDMERSLGRLPAVAHSIRVKVQPPSSLSGSEQRRTCGIDGFSCGRSICLRCAG